MLREGYDYDFSRCDPTGAHVDPAWCAIYETVTVSGPDGELGPMLAESWRQDPERDERLALPDPARACASSRARRATRRPSPRRCACTAIRSRRRSTPSSGGTSPACAPRATRCSSSSTSRAPGCRGCCARGTRRSTTRRARRAAGEEFGRTTADGTGPFTFVESVSGSHLDVARWDGYPGARTTWQDERAGPAYLDGVRWIPILDDRERAAALERGEIDCLQNASLLDVDRLAANPDLEVIEFQQSALVYLGVDCEGVGADVRVRRAISQAIDRQALVDRDLDGPRLAGVLADPVALAVVRAGGRGVRRLRPARGGAAARRGRARSRAPTASGSSSRRWS